MALAEKTTAYISQLDVYKRKRVEALQRDIEEIEGGSSQPLQGKRRKSEREREEKLARAARRRDWSVHIAEVDRQKELDDIADWWKIEAKRTKEETYAKICDSIDAIKRELNVWDGPEDMLENLGRKLRTRGADGKALSFVCVGCYT
jgi:hypothetical protein